MTKTMMKKSRKQYNGVIKKAGILFWAIIFLLAFTSCFADEDSETAYIKASGFDFEITSEIKDVDLDGRGERNDKVVASAYETEDRKNTSFSLIEVYLADGRYVSKQYNGYCTPSVLAGDFLGTGRQQIVVITTAKTSGYKSSDIHVLEVRDGEDDRAELRERLTILDGSVDGRDEAVVIYKSTLYMIQNKGGLANSSYPNLTDFCAGAVVVPGDNGEKDSLKIYHLRNDNGQRAYSLLQWNGSQWNTMEQGFEVEPQK